MHHPITRQLLKIPNIIEVLHKASQESRHVLDPQNTVTFDASYCTRKSYKDKSTIDALFSESTNTPKSIDSSEGFVGFISRLNQRSLPLQKVKQSSQLHAKKLYRKNKNKPSYFLLPKHHFFRYLCCHRSFPQDKNSAVNFCRQKKIATIADLIRQKLPLQSQNEFLLRKSANFPFQKI